MSELPKLFLSPDMKSVWKISSTMYPCPLVEAKDPIEAVKSARSLMGDEFSQDFVSGIYQIEKIGQLPNEYNKMSVIVPHDLLSDDK